MAVTLTGAGGLFTRMGKLGFVIEKIRDHQNLNPNGLKKEIEDVITEYAAADQHMLAGLPGQIVAIQTNAMNPLAQLRAVAAATVVAMVHNDNPQPDNGLTTALIELIRQMVSSANTVQRNTSNSIAVAYASGNTGNGYAAAESRDIDLLLDSGGTINYFQENIRDEDILLDCTADAQFSGTAGRETFAVNGEAAVPDGRHPDWPDTKAGSGISSSLRVSDPAESAAQNTPGRQMLTNGGFNTFTVTNTPDSWTIVTGTPGTEIFEEGTIVYRGAKGLAMMTTSRIEQTLATGTAGKLRPGNKYMLYCRLRADAAVVAGTVKFNLVDGSGTLVTSGTSGSEISQAASGISTGSFDAKSQFFNAPLVLPSTVKARIDLSGVTAAKKIYIDDVLLVPAPKFGTVGPYIAATPGSTPWKLRDRITVTVTNDHSGKFQKLFDLLFDMYRLNLKLPFDSSPTISDTLIA